MELKMIFFNTKISDLKIRRAKEGKNPFLRCLFVPRKMRGKLV